MEFRSKVLLSLGLTTLAILIIALAIVDNKCGACSTQDETGTQQPPAGAEETSEELLQQCRNESQATSTTSTTQLQNDTCLNTLASGNDELIFSHEGQLFYVNNYSKLSWNKARTWCQALGSDLAQPSDNLEYFLQEVEDRFSDVEHMWLGASDHRVEGEWKWVSGRELSDGFPWTVGEPNNHDGEEHCLEWWIVRKKAVYNDAPCERSYNFACQLGPAQ